MLKLTKIINLLECHDLTITNTIDDKESCRIKNLSEIINQLKDFEEQIKNVGCAISTPETPNNAIGITHRKEYRDMLSSLNIKPLSESSQLIQICLKYIQTNVIEYFLKPFNEAPPLFELFCFNDTVFVKRHIVGAPRSAIHNASVNPNYYLLCECCELKSSSNIAGSLPDVCIAYKLHLEYGKMINLYDWLQAFRAILEPDAEDDDIDPKIQ